MKFWILLLLSLTMTSLSLAQDQYVDDYGQDTLYHDYAARQGTKGVGKPGLPWGTIVASAGAGWFVGAKFHTRRLRKSLGAKHKQEQKALYQQYYTDVYTLQQQNAELVAAIEQMGVKVR